MVRSVKGTDLAATERKEMAIIDGKTMGRIAKFEI
jgi:hypothetical protein